MVRTRHIFPLEARQAKDDLIDSWEQRVRAGEQAVRGCEDEIEALRNESTIAQTNYSHQRAKLDIAASGTSGPPDRRAEVLRNRDEALASLKSEYESACAARMAKRNDLEATRERLRAELKQERERTQALKEAGWSLVGLAPWDILAMRAQRDLNEAPGAPGTLPTEDRVEMMKASEAADFVQQRLGISRSTYYARFRPLIRSYPISPKLYFRMPDGCLTFARRATFRFRRDEVEAMLDFWTAQAF